MGIASYALHYSTETAIGHNNHQLSQAAELSAQNRKTKSGEDHFTLQGRTKPWRERKNILLRKQKHIKLWVVVIRSNLFIKLSSFF